MDYLSHPNGFHANPIIGGYPLPLLSAKPSIDLAATGVGSEKAEGGPPAPIQTPRGYPSTLGAVVATRVDESSPRHEIIWLSMFAWIVEYFSLCVLCLIISHEFRCWYFLM